MKSLRVAQSYLLGNKKTNNLTKKNSPSRIRFFKKVPEKQKIKFSWPYLNNNMYVISIK